MYPAVAVYALILVSFSTAQAVMVLLRSNREQWLRCSRDSTLLVRVEDVVLRLHFHMAGVSAI
jgi:hypothetical protein